MSFPKIKRAVEPSQHQIGDESDSLVFYEEEVDQFLDDIKEERVSRSHWAKQLAEKLWYYGQIEDSIIGSVRAELLRQSEEDSK